MFLRNLWFMLRGHKPCPMNGFVGSIEFVQFNNWLGELTMETPRECLEFLDIKEIVAARGQNIEDHTRWINREEKERIIKHHHTKMFKKIEKESF